MEPLSAEAADVLRAAAEVFVPGPPHDEAYGAADVSAELFIGHYLDYLAPGLANTLPEILDTAARERGGERFAGLSLAERERVLNALTNAEIEQVREIPTLLGVLTIAAVYGEWSGQDADGNLVRTPLGWRLAGYPGPRRGTLPLLQRPV